MHSGACILSVRYGEKQQTKKLSVTGTGPGHTGQRSGETASASYNIIWDNVTNRRQSVPGTGGIHIAVYPLVRLGFTACIIAVRVQPVFVTVGRGGDHIRVIPLRLERDFFYGNP